MLYKGFVPQPLACFGDSISDNLAGSPSRWPSWLAGFIPGTSVAGCGVSGNDTANLLARLSAHGIWTYNVFVGFNDPNGFYTMPSKCFVLIGINDILFQTHTAPQMIANLASIYAQLEAMGVQVTPMTIMPFGGSTSWTAGLETQRATVNTWIRGTQPRHYIDLESLGGGGAQPSLLAQYDGGDGIHPSILGSKQIAALAALT